METNPRVSISHIICGYVYHILYAGIYAKYIPTNSWVFICGCMPILSLKFLGMYANIMNIYLQIPGYLCQIFLQIPGYLCQIYLQIPGYLYAGVCQFFL